MLSVFLYKPLEVFILNSIGKEFLEIIYKFFNGVSFSKKALMSLVNVKDKMFLLIISLGL